MTHMHPIQTHNLSLDFDDVHVLRGVEWSVPEGSMTGLIGRNGAGKSTLLHTVLGLLIPTGGECKTLGQDSRSLDDEALAQVGFVDQQARLLQWLSVEEQLHYVALLRPGWDYELERELLEKFELGPDWKRRVSSLSAGAAQRLAVMTSLCHRPKLILLDEPVSAQDPVFRGVVLDAVKSRAIEDGSSVVLSSHVLRDIEATVDRITVLKDGVIGTNEELDTLKEQYQEWRVVNPDTNRLVVATERYVLRSERTGAGLRLWVRAGESERRQFEQAHGVTVEVRSVGLDEMFPLLLGASNDQGTDDARMAVTR